jgi:flavorubredoxin
MASHDKESRACNGQSEEIKTCKTMKKIAKDIYYVGVNDRQKHIFENLWPLPRGVSYNSYLIMDEKTVLIDTVEIGYVDLFMKKIEEVLHGRTLDYLIVNHMEPDHAGCIRILRQYHPNLQIVGNRLTLGMLAGYHFVTDGLVEVKEGDTIQTGTHRLAFYMAPMVHWPEVMVAYEETEKILFSADAFGTFGTLDGGVIDSEIGASLYWEEMVRYYANIVGKYGNPVQKALRTLAVLDIEKICPTHGPVWVEHKDTAIDIYDRLSRYEAEEGVTIIYGSMYGNTEQMAETIASSIVDEGIRNIVMHNVSKSSASFILKDIFNYQGVIIGSPTYSSGLFPEIESILRMIELREVRPRFSAFFGSFTWAGTAVKLLSAFNEKMKWEMVCEPVEMKQSMNTETHRQCIRLGKAMAARLFEK